MTASQLFPCASASFYRSLSAPMWLDPAPTLKPQKQNERLNRELTIEQRDLFVFAADRRVKYFVHIVSTQKRDRCLLNDTIILIHKSQNS